MVGEKKKPTVKSLVEDFARLANTLTEQKEKVSGLITLTRRLDSSVRSQGKQVASILSVSDNERLAEVCERIAKAEKAAVVCTIKQCVFTELLFLCDKNEKQMVKVSRWLRKMVDAEDDFWFEHSELTLREWMEMVDRDVEVRAVSE